MAKYYHVVMRQSKYGLVDVVAKDEAESIRKAQELLYMGRVHMAEEGLSTEVREMETSELHIYEKLQLDCKNLFCTWRDRVYDYEVGKSIGLEQDELQVCLELSEMRGIFNTIESFTGHPDFGANILSLFGAYTSQNEVSIEESNELLDMIDKEFYALGADSEPACDEEVEQEPPKKEVSRATQNLRSLCAQLLKSYRANNNLTQEELGKRIGVRKERVSKWECEAAAPNRSLRKKIEEELGVDLTQGLKACLRAMKRNQKVKKHE